jgi:hypothetical protein
MNRRADFLYFFLVAIVIGVFFPLPVFCQDNVLELFPDPDPVVVATNDSDSISTSLFLDAGALFMPINNVLIPGLAVKFGSGDKHFASGVAFDLIKTNKVFFSEDPTVTSPRYTYFSFGWYNEYICNPQKRVSVAFHLKAAFGYADYSDNKTVINYYQADDSSSYSTPVYSSSSLIASSSFIAIEPGINVLYNIKKWISIGAGWDSRILFRISSENPLRDDTYYSGNIFLRFRIPEKADHDSQ